MKIVILLVLCLLVGGFCLIWVSTLPTLPALPEAPQLCDSVTTYTMYEVKVEEVAQDRKWIRIPAVTFNSEALKGTSERVHFCQSNNGKLTDGAEFVKRGQWVRLCVKNVMGKWLISCIAFLSQ